METGRKLVAVILSDKCGGCGICTDVCPESAIEVNTHAVVDWNVCTGCGKCVYECPNEAVILAPEKKLVRN